MFRHLPCMLLLFVLFLLIINFGKIKSKSIPVVGSRRLVMNTEESRIDDVNHFLFGDKADASQLSDVDIIAALCNSGPEACGFTATGSLDSNGRNNNIMKDSSSFVSSFSFSSSSSSSSSSFSSSSPKKGDSGQLYEDADFETEWDSLDGIRLRWQHPSVLEDHINPLFKPHGGTLEFRNQIETVLMNLGLGSPRSAPLWVPLGNTWRATGNTTNAINCFRRALWVKSNDADALTNLAAIMENVGYVEDAFSLVSAAVRLRPENPVQYFILANIHHHKRHVRKAMSACESALALHPNFYPCRAKLDALRKELTFSFSSIWAGDFSADAAISVLVSVTVTTVFSVCCIVFFFRSRKNLLITRNDSNTSNQKQQQHMDKGTTSSSISAWNKSVGKKSKWFGKKN